MTKLKEEALAAAKKRIAAKQQSAVEALYNNDSYMDKLVLLDQYKENVAKLEINLIQLNEIPAFKAKDGRKFSVTAFKEATRIFGSEMGAMIGIIIGASKAFTEEQRSMLEPITGIDSVQLEILADKLGKPAYCTKGGEVVEAVPGDYEYMYGYLSTLDNGLNPLDMSYFTKDKYLLWFTVAELNAQKAQAEHEAVVTLDAEDYVLTDAE